jgi:adenylate kinase
MRLILVGPPGAGKGTQAVQLASHFSIPHISTGDIFRLNIKGETKLGLHAKSFMDAGNLVPDSVTNDMVADRLTHADAKNGFLLDGYPRNIGQADFLKENLDKSGTPLDAVLEFKLENVEIIARGYKVTFVERLLRLPLTAGCYGLKGWSKVCEFPNLLTDQFEI